MRARPLRNPVVTWGPDKKGDMVIHVPLEAKRWATRFRRFIPHPDQRHILLDDIGADVWEMCDGEHTIDAIRRHITAKYKLNQKEAEASLIAHLQNLAKRKLIVALSDPNKADGEEKTEAPPPPPQSKNRPSPHQKKRR